MFLQLKIFFSVLLVVNFVSSCNGAVVQPTNQLSRIAFGKNSSIEKHPHLVGVSSSLGHCAGSLISSTCVLTAAHCVYNKTTEKDIPAEDFTIRGGTTIFGEGGYVHYVEKLRMPKNYGKILFDMDVAVIKLKQPMKGKNVKPIEIDFGDENNNPDDLMTVAGWGYTEFTSTVSKQLKETHVTKSSCSIWETVSPILDFIVKVFGLRFELTENMLCASDLGNPCKGDSGGALVQNGKQIGIVSFGVPGCGMPLPSVYTNLKSHEVKEFFVDATQELNCWD